MRSGKRWITAGLCCLTLLIGSPPPILADDNGKSFAQDLSAAKRAGIPTTPKELQAPLPPPNQNAAPLYTKLTKILEAKPLSKDDKIIEYSGQRGVLSPEQFERLRRALKSRSDVVSLVHQAVARPQCIFVRDWTTPQWTPTFEHIEMRFAARLIAAESRLMTYDNKILEAIRNQALGFQVARHISAESQQVGCMEANSLDSIALSGFQRMLCLSGGDAKVAEAVQATVQRDYQPHSLRNALKLMAGCDIVMLDFFHKKGSRKGKEEYRHTFMPDNKQPSLEDWSAFIYANSRVLLRCAYSLIAAADLPYWQSAPVFQLAHTKLEKDSNPKLMFAQTSNLSTFHDDQLRTRMKATAEVTRAGAFLLAWKAKHGAFPEKLDGASMPKFVDPFDGKPLRYRREGAGFVVYSVGATGKFTGGPPDQKAGNETRFRYPAPPEFTAPLKEE